MFIKVYRLEITIFLCTFRPNTSFRICTLLCCPSSLLSGSALTEIACSKYLWKYKITINYSCALSTKYIISQWLGVAVADNFWSWAISYIRSLKKSRADGEEVSLRKSGLTLPLDWRKHALFVSICVCLGTRGFFGYHTNFQTGSFLGSLYVDFFTITTLPSTPKNQKLDIDFSIVKHPTHDLFYILSIYTRTKRPLLKSFDL